MGNRILFRDEDFPLRSLLNLSELNFNRIQLLEVILTDNFVLAVWKSEELAEFCWISFSTFARLGSQSREEGREIFKMARRNARQGKRNQKVNENRSIMRDDLVTILFSIAKLTSRLLGK